MPQIISTSCSRGAEGRKLWDEFAPVRFGVGRWGRGGKGSRCFNQVPLEQGPGQPQCRRLSAELAKADDRHQALQEKAGRKTRHKAEVRQFVLVFQSAPTLCPWVATGQEGRKLGMLGPTSCPCISQCETAHMAHMARMAHTTHMERFHFSLWSSFW